MSEFKKVPPTMFSWDEKKKEYQEIKGDEELVKKQWEEFDMFAYLLLWFLVTAM
jgi:hypothetical protein